MRSALSRIVLGSALAAWPALIGCTANIHDNTVSIPNANVQLNTSADVNNVKPGQPLPLQVKADSVFLVPPSATPPPEHMSDAGHFQFYFDNVDSTPILITADVNVTVTIPMDAKDGDHKVICRLHKHDGMPTNVTSEVKIKVKVVT
jgi:hypothetical protein